MGVAWGVGGTGWKWEELGQGARFDEGAWLWETGRRALS